MCVCPPCLFIVPASLPGALIVFDGERIMAAFEIMISTAIFFPTKILKLLPLLNSIY